VEFLDGMNEPRYRHLLENVPGPIPISEAFHLYLIDLLRGAFVENFAAQQLMAHFGQGLYYRPSKRGLNRERNQAFCAPERVRGTVIIINLARFVLN